MKEYLSAAKQDVLMVLVVQYEKLRTINSDFVDINVDISPMLDVIFLSSYHLSIYPLDFVRQPALF